MSAFIRVIFLSALITITGGFVTKSAAQFMNLNRISVQLHAGSTIANYDSAVRFFGSNLSENTEATAAFGGGVRIDVTPFWSLEGGYRYFTILGDGESTLSVFETDVHNLMLKNYFNFNSLYRQHPISRYINPYLTLAVGYDIFSYESPDNSFDDSSPVVSFGPGFSSRVNNRFELFGQYDFQLGSNSLDGVTGGIPVDQIGIVTGGVRVYLGSF